LKNILIIIVVLSCWILPSSVHAEIQTLTHIVINPLAEVSLRMTHELRVSPEQNEKPLNVLALILRVLQ